jgi:outer membrane receptor protein involved in Fe transport
MRPLSIGLIAALFLTAALSGQIRLTGRVVSDTNAPITNAVVTVRPASGTGQNARAFTDKSGAFATQVPGPGAYLLNAEAVGYYTLKDRALAVVAGDHELTVTLDPVREFSDSMDVTAASGSVALDQTASEETLTGAQMIDIPFPVTQDLKAAMRALPDVVQDNSNSVHLNGGAENQTLFLLDGFNINDPLTGTFTTRLSIEGIQEMNVETGAVSAEYGKGSAGVMSVSTRTGDDRIRYSATNFVPGVDNNKGFRVGSWNPRLNLSGPVRRRRVWFADSFWGQYNQTVIQELPPGSDISSSLRYSNFLHVQANLTPTNIASFGFLASMWNANRVGLGALDPVETTLGERQRQWFAYAKDQLYFGHGAVAEFGVSSNRTFSRQIPYGTGLYVYTPYGRSGNYFVRGTQDGSRDQAIANAYLPSFNWGGAHQFKVGTDVDWLSYAQDLTRTGYEYLNANNAPVRLVLFGGNGQFGRNNLETTAYVQDSWRWRPDVLVELGVRSDWDRLLGNWTASPRVGIAWSPKPLENTRISGGYAVSYDETNLELFTRPLDQFPMTYYYPPFGNPADPVLSSFVTGSGYRSPRFSTWNLAVDHRMGPNVTLRAQAIRRRGSNGLTYVGSSNLTTVPDVVYRLTNARTDAYDSVGFTARQNFRKEYGWMLSYTRSRAASNAVVDVSSDTPLLLNGNAGRLPWDAPNRIVGWAYVPTFWRDWAIASLFEYRTGFPFSIENTAGQVVGNVNSMRFPTFLELNLHIEKRFDFHGQRWAARVGYNNITGHQNPNVVNNMTDSPQFLAFYGGQTRALQFRMRWLGKLK